MFFAVVVAGTEDGKKRRSNAMTKDERDIL